MFLSRNLEQLFDYEICGLVVTGEEAIEYAGEKEPDIVLMDIRLASAMNGIEAAREIKSRYDIPLIFVTGYVSPEYLAQCQSLDPVAILEKPVDPPEIDAAIKLAFT